MGAFLILVRSFLKILTANCFGSFHFIDWYVGQPLAVEIKGIWLVPPAPLRFTVVHRVTPPGSRPIVSRGFMSIFLIYPKQCCLRIEPHDTIVRQQGKCVSAGC